MRTRELQSDCMGVGSGMVAAPGIDGCGSPPGPSVSEAPLAEYTPGQRLRAERERRGLSVAEAAKQLRLAPRQVEAMEGDDLTALPGGLFARGFLRNYALLLGLDAAVVAAAGSAVGEAPTPGEPAAGRVVEAAGPRPSLAIAVPERRRRYKRASAARVLAVVVVVAAVLLAALSTLHPPPSEVVLVQPEAALPGAQPGETPSAPAADAHVSRATMPAADPAADEAAAAAGLRFRFLRDSWVEVRDAEGRVIFSQLNLKGGSQEVRGRPPLRLVVGGASGVELSYRGTPVDLAPHTRTDVARLTLE